MKRWIPALAAAVLLSGCGSAPAASQTPSPVYTDWSKLTPYEPAQAKYSRFTPYSGEGPLQPREDYGSLLPYIGAELYVDGYILDKLPLYGLVTAQGEVVTAPVYAQLSWASRFLLLFRGGGTPYPRQTEGQELFALTVAAEDGRWVRETDGYYAGSGSGLLAVGGRDGSLSFWNSEGETVIAFPAEALQARLGSDLVYWNQEGGPWLSWVDDRVAYVTSYNHAADRENPPFYLDLRTGQVLDMPPEGVAPEIDYGGMDTAEGLKLPEYSYLDPIVDGVSGAVYYYGYRRAGDAGGYDLLDVQGRVVYADYPIGPFLWQPIIRAGLLSTMEDGCFCYRAVDSGQIVFCYPVQTNND